jgi:hypothetical protein
VATWAVLRSCHAHDREQECNHKSHRLSHLASPDIITQLIRLISPPKERRFGQLGFPAGPASRSWEVNIPAVRRAPKEERRLILQVVQPGLLGLMDGSVSTLAPLFAPAAMTGKPHDAFVVGLAASLGAGISMGLAEALSDDGEISGRGSPLSEEA